MKPWRAYTNIFALRLNRALKREVIRNYPVLAYIEPTLFCNLRCPACPTGLRLNLRPAARIDPALFHAMIDEVGDYLFALHMYNWGEPLLFPQTPDLIRYAKTRDMAITLSSNLSLPLGDDMIERLVRSGLDRLVVSLDGAMPDTYRFYRRQGNFDRVRENMQRLQAAKTRLDCSTPEIVWQFLVFRHNEHEIDIARAEYRAWGADTLVIAGAHMPPNDPNFSPSTLPAYNLYHPDHAYQQGARRAFRGACSWLYGGVVLNPDGNVSPCCGVPAANDDFGVYDPASGFHAVWNGERYRRARRLFRRRARAGVTDLDGRLDGMGVQVQTQADELICQHCPIPFRQDDADKIIARTAYDLLRRALHERSPRYLVALVLMGGPNRAGIGWLMRRGKRLLMAF
jgi:hypothetical protein